MTIAFNLFLGTLESQRHQMSRRPEGGSLMLWEAISPNNKTDLVVLNIMNTQVQIEIVHVGKLFFEVFFAF